MKKWLWLILSIVFIVPFTLVRSSLLPERQVVLIPFESFITLCSVGWGGHGKYIARGLAANILLMLPLGLVLSKYECEKWKVLTPFLISLTIETIQYFTRLGTFEVDDLICNTIGSILGYELGKQISGPRKGRFIIPGIYFAALGLCCLKSILFN